MQATVAVLVLRESNPACVCFSVSVCARMCVCVNGGRSQPHDRGWRAQIYTQHSSKQANPAQIYSLASFEAFSSVLTAVTQLQLFCISTMNHRADACSLLWLLAKKKEKRENECLPVGLWRIVACWLSSTFTSFYIYWCAPQSGGAS